MRGTHLSDQESRVICVPAGWASWIKAESADSVLMVMSDKTFDEAMALSDSYRFPGDFCSGRGMKLDAFRL